ncbi:acyl-CoA dehydrogenase family protein [Sulfitobacter porphyrae]|uniref:Acyl-CoA dehydrogenase family protein n=1 Tax=Sulfitobacter porphyrae TaxID=1246864 RepID=A0ABW2B8C6_9RHOB
MYDNSVADRYFSQDHQAFRQSLRNFVASEVTPNVDKWEATGRLPRDLYRKGEMGIQGVLFPEDVGGSDGDFFMQVVVTEEISRCGAGGVCASLGSHSIGIPPVVKHGSDALRQKFAVPVIAGKRLPRWRSRNPAVDRMWRR